MPITNFQGSTFVAFTDIAGFKAMMNDGIRGPEALNALYASGYAVIAEQDTTVPRIEGLFISDCGVLFVRNEERPLIERIQSLLNAVEHMTRRCFECAVQLTTSIAWGEFSYHERFEILGITKHPIYGNVYVSAFIDNESDKPRLYPNECRIVKRNLPDAVVDFFLQQSGVNGERIRDSRDHFYFEWMRPRR